MFVLLLLRLLLPVLLHLSLLQQFCVRPHAEKFLVRAMSLMPLFMLLIFCFGCRCRCFIASTANSIAGSAVVVAASTDIFVASAVVPSAVAGYRFRFSSVGAFAAVSSEMIDLW